MGKVHVREVRLEAVHLFMRTRATVMEGSSGRAHLISSARSPERQVARESRKVKKLRAVAPTRDERGQALQLRSRKRARKRLSRHRFAAPPTGTLAALQPSLSLRFGSHLRPSTQVGPTMAAKPSTPPAGELRWVGPRFAAAATKRSASSLQRFFDNSLACCPPVSQPHAAVSYQ
jgi:hypothetical protein